MRRFETSPTGIRPRTTADFSSDVYVAWETYHTARTEWLATSASLTEPGIVWTEHIEKVQLAHETMLAAYYVFRDAKMSWVANDRTARRADCYMGLTQGDYDILEYTARFA